MMNFRSMSATTEDKKLFMGIVVLGLISWASISLIFMLVRSWSATNWDWVSILSGLLCFGAALAICAWKHTVLDYGERGDEDGTY